MITGDVKQKIDRVWDAFWSGGIINPLEVIEQITYLLFIRRLDDLQTRAERKARYTGKLIENPVFSPEQKSMRWHEFRNAAPAVMFWPTAPLWVNRNDKPRRLSHPGFYCMCRYATLQWLRGASIP